MTGMVTSGTFDAAGAVIPVWAVQALVANTSDILNAVNELSDQARDQHTLLHPSQIAWWRTLRPGARSLLANILSVVCSEAGMKAWLG